MLTEEYATFIAREWNTKDAGNGGVGYVTRFEVDAEYLKGFDTHEVGGRESRRIDESAACTKHTTSATGTIARPATGATSRSSASAATTAATTLRRRPRRRVSAATASFTICGVRRPPTCVASVFTS